MNYIYRQIDTGKYKEHTDDGWGWHVETLFKNFKTSEITDVTVHCSQTNNTIAKLAMVNGEKWTEEDFANAKLIADSPDLLGQVKSLRKALEIERQIVQAFYEYRDECCFDHCEAWMLEKGYRVMVNGQSEWATELQEEE